MNTNLHNMNMVKTYMESASDQLDQALTKLDKFVSINNIALYNEQIINVKDSINNQIVIVKNNIIPKIEETE